MMKIVRPKLSQAYQAYQFARGPLQGDLAEWLGGALVRHDPFAGVLVLQNLRSGRVQVRAGDWIVSEAGELCVYEDAVFSEKFMVIS